MLISDPMVYNWCSANPTPGFSRKAVSPS